MFMENEKISNNIILTSAIKDEPQEEISEDIDTFISENNIKISIPKDFIKDIEKGKLIEIFKKVNDTYTYFSKNTLGALLFLSRKPNIKCPLEKVIFQENFPEFFYDLGYTDLKAVFWLDIDGKKENLYKYYEVFLKYQEQVEGEILDVERTMPIKILNLFYDHIKDYNIGLYSTIESLFQFILLPKYNAKILKEKKTKEKFELRSLYDCLKNDNKFVRNKIADDILQEYIDDFENHYLHISKKKYNAFEEKVENETELSVKEGALYNKGKLHTIPNTYMTYNALLLNLDSIFGIYYETYGNVMTINDVTIFDNPKEFIKLEYPIEQIRIYELLLSLWKSKYIDITDIHIDLKNKKYLLTIEFNNSPTDIIAIRKKINSIVSYTIDKAFKYSREDNELFYDGNRIIPNEENKRPPKAYFKALLYLLDKAKEIEYSFIDIEQVFENATGNFFDGKKNSNWAQNCVSKINKFLTKTKYELTKDKKEPKIGLKKKKETKKPPKN